MYQSFNNVCRSPNNGLSSVSFTPSGNASATSHHPGRGAAARRFHQSIAGIKSSAYT